MPSGRVPTMRTIGLVITLSPYQGQNFLSGAQDSTVSIIDKRENGKKLQLLSLKSITDQHFVIFGCAFILMQHNAA